MTGKLDKQMRGLSQRLIDEYGKPVTLKEFTGNTFDPSTGTNTPSYSNHSVNGVIDDYSENRTDGTLVKVGDLRLSVPAKDLTFNPSTEDKVVIDSVEWSIVNPQRIYSGEQVATYQLQIRK